MTPKASTILKHLKLHGNITHIEALLWYQTQDLAGRIRELRTLDHNIESVYQKDALGNRFVRYTLLKREPIPRNRSLVVLPARGVTVPYNGPALNA